MMSIQPGVSQTMVRTGLQMAAAGGREGACSAPLKDGRSLVIGGNNAGGPLAAEECFERGGRFRSVSPMLAPRTDHVCIALDDGTVLVVGGAISRDSLTNAAEIFHPDANSWTPAGPMLTARRSAAIILLNNGKALVAGGSGQAITTFEIYDLADNRFEQAAGTLSAARTGCALAILGDGRVLIAAGFEQGRALDSMDIYDPATGIAYAGRMSVARANFTATALDDGRVLLTGGTDGTHELASPEVYDPATGGIARAGPLAAPQQNHIAVRPARTGRVLSAGGTAGGRQATSAELFTPAENAFEPASEAGDRDSSTPAISIGILGSDATLRAVKPIAFPQKV